MYEWDWPAAEQHFLHSIDRDANYAFPRYGRAHLLSDTGRDDEAVKQAEAALALDPTSVYGEMLLGHFLYQAGRYTEASDHIHRGLELEPRFWVAHLTLGKIHQQMGRYEEAFAALGQAKSLGSSSEALSMSGYVAAVAGRRRQAVDVLGELMALSHASQVPPYNIAVVHLGLGQTAETLRWLEKAYRERDPHMVFIGAIQSGTPYGTNQSFTASCSA